MGRGKLMTGVRPSRLIRLGIVFIVLVAVCVGLWAVLPSNKPPVEERLLKTFYSNRSTYEHLRDMLQTDGQVRAVYTRFGVETASSGLPHPPSEAHFSSNRYNEYKVLLDQVGSPEVFRRGENNSETCISLWASGFAGDTRHVDLCWLDHVPANQIARLDDFYRTPKPRHPVFRHVDGNWYLWADW
jgi:hypothetical protein